MNNWRLLLLAVVVVVQPFGSFTESNLIDGRERCERSEDARLYGYRKTDERRSLDGNREDRRVAHEERRLRSDVREERRYDTYRGPMLTRSESLERNERRFSPELSRSTEHRLLGEQELRYRDTFARNRAAREDHNRNRDESRNFLGQNERNSRESRNRDTLDASRTFIHSRDGRDTRSVERESRSTVSRLPIRTFRSNEERRVKEKRERSTVKRENVARTDIRRDSRLSASARSDSRLQLDDNRERRIFDRRNEGDGTEFRRSRFSDARINEVRAVRAQRSIVQNERNNHVSKDVRVESRKDQPESGLRDRVSAVRRDSERYSTDRVRETRLGDRMDNRINERIDGHRHQRDVSRRFTGTLRNTDDRRVDSREIRASRSLDMDTRNDLRMERRSISLDNRLSRSSERITRDERAARIRDVRGESLDDRRQVRNNNHLSSANTEPMQETSTRNDNWKASNERRQQREVRERENSLSRDRISMLREKHEVRDSNERIQEARRTVRYNIRSDLRRHVLERSMERARNENEERRNDIRELSSTRSADVSRIREDTRVKESERQQIRSQERGMEREAGNADTLRLESRRSIRSDGIRLERIVRNRDVIESGDQDRTHRILERTTRGVLTPQRIDTRRSSKPETIRLERRVRNRDEARENERQDLQRDKRDGRTLLNRQASERFAERRQENRDFAKGSRNVRMARIRDEIRGERILAERRQDSRETVTDSREVQMARNRDEVRGERVLAERRQDTRETVTDSREVRMARNRDEVRGERVLAERRQDTRETVTDSREIRMARNRDEVRGERVLAERRQDTRETVTESREVRMARNRDEVRGERVLAERRQDTRETVTESREVRMARNRDEVRGERVLAERRQDTRETVTDSREVRMARNRDEVRGERVLTERRQENRDATRDSRNGREARNRDFVRSERTVRSVRGEIVAERSDSRRQRDARDVRALQRESYVKELTERSRNSDARSSERQMQLRNLRSDVREYNKNEIRGTSEFLLERRNSEREERRENIRSVMNNHKALAMEDEHVFSNWQMVFYTLQGVYLCGLLVQMLTENANKKKRSFNWWSSAKNIIKVD